jgi:hypothetical protein
MWIVSASFVVDGCEVSHGFELTNISVRELERWGRASLHTGSSSRPLGARLNIFYKVEGEGDAQSNFELVIAAVRKFKGMGWRFQRFQITCRY